MSVLIVVDEYAVKVSRQAVVDSEESTMNKWFRLYWTWVHMSGGFVVDIFLFPEEENFGGMVPLLYELTPF